MPIPAGPTPDSERLVTLAKFKRWLNIEGSSQADEILDVLVAATEWVEWRIGGPVAVTTFTETGKVNGFAYVPINRPLVSVASITPDLGVAVDASRYQADTTVNMIRFRSGVTAGWYTFVYDAGLAGPGRLERNAGMELGRHLWLTQNGSVGRGRSDDDIPVPMGFAVPRRVDEMLMPKHIPGFA